MDSLTDPAVLRADDAVAFREETAAVDGETLDAWAPLSGVGVVGVTDAAGRVLLMTGPHGWRLPYFTVESGEDWATVTRAVAETLAGAGVTVEGVERVTRVERRVEADGSDAERGDGAPDRAGETDVTHDVLLRASADRDAAPGEHPDLAERTDHVEGVEWFDHVPGSVYDDHEDTVADIERFL